MNWTYRRPFRNQFNYGGGMNKSVMNRPVEYVQENPNVRKSFPNQPIDAIRLQLADYDSSYYGCPVHHPRRNHPYITTFSDKQSSPKRTHSSVHSVSTIQTDVVHQRVSTIHTYPSSSSLIERQAMIDEENNRNDLNPIKYLNVAIQTDPFEEQNEQVKVQQMKESNHCRRCIMLIEIVDQQAQQIRQYTEQISEQADLLASLARRFASQEINFDQPFLENNNQTEINHSPPHI